MQRHHRHILPIYPNSSPAELRHEVLQVWDHSPSTWNYHLNPASCSSTAEFIKLVSDLEDELQASGVEQIQKLVQAEVQRHNAQSHNARRAFAVQLVDINEKEEEDGVNTPALAVNYKPKPHQDGSKAPGKYLYPFANNKSKKVPPCPCWNCRNPLHYDRNCASWRKQGRPKNKTAPASRVNDIYNKAYIAMLEDDEVNYDMHCARYNVYTSRGFYSQDDPK
jgi:hypothetical protein